MKFAGVPTWVAIYAVIAGIIPILFAIFALINPDLFDGSLGSSKGLYIVRNVATGLLMFSAIALASRAMIFTALLLRMITDIGDSVVLLSAGMVIALPIVVPLITVSAVAITVLWRDGLRAALKS